MVQIFTFFEGRAVKAKIKTGPTHRYFTCKACGECGFLEVSSEGSGAI